MHHPSFATEREGATGRFMVGYLCGARGTLLFESYWAALLDTPEPTMDSYAFSAAQRGWLDYRRLGNVADIGFSFLLRPDTGQEASQVSNQ